MKVVTDDEIGDGGPVGLGGPGFGMQAGGQAAGRGYRWARACASAADWAVAPGWPSGIGLTTTAVP